ncbi:MAG: cell division protein ZapE [Pseudomonadota bacterium]
MKKGPAKRYRDLVRSGALQPDPAQEEAVTRLQALHEAVLKYASRRDAAFPMNLFARTPSAPRGLYLWGGVGRGKTLLMDLFFNNTDVAAKRRVHFHEFMADAHARIAKWRGADESERRRHKAFDKKAPDDPIGPVAHDLADEAMLLCFDEFQVSDIADAMILGRLFDALFAHGVVVVATSNRVPDDLYKDGLNRQLFVPFIETLKERLDVHELRAKEDYRLAKFERAPVYYHPLGPEADAAMDAAWADLICGATEQAETLEVQGRRLEAPRTARGAARFAFAALCENPLGPSDYLAIAGRYSTVFVDAIPMMGPASRNEAKRFVTLIDALYDARTKLVCSADAEPEDLYPAGDGAFEFERTVSRLMEMRTADYLAAAHGLQTTENG